MTPLTPGRGQPPKKLSETRSTVRVHSASYRLTASLVYCNKHTVALVNINSNIVHEQESPFDVATHANTKLKLFSCYLLPFLSALDSAAASPPPNENDYSSFGDALQLDYRERGWIDLATGRRISAVRFHDQKEQEHLWLF